MTRIDRKRYTLPTGAGKTTQQKRHPVRSALKNGGADVRDGFLSLKPGLAFPVYQAKNREFCPFWISFADFGDISQ